MNLSPLPIQKFFDNNGRPLAGGLLFTYAAGTATKIASYKDKAGTLNTNPVVLDYRGEANVWLDPSLTYKFVLSPVGDTDPPTKPIWTVDNIQADVSLTQLAIGGTLVPTSSITVVTDGQTPYVGSAAGPILNMTASRVAVQGFWIQNKNTATNATNYGLEVANDTVGKELYVFNTSTTYSTSWGAGIPAGPAMGVDTPATAGFITLSKQSRNIVGANLATGDITIGNPTDAGAVNTYGSWRFGDLTEVFTAPTALVKVARAGDASIAIRETVANVETYVGAAAAGGYIGTPTNDPLQIYTNNVFVGAFDTSAVAGNTRFLLYDVTAGTVVRVSRGAADSGGVGFRVLRIPN